MKEIKTNSGKVLYTANRDCFPSEIIKEAIEHFVSLINADFSYQDLARINLSHMWLEGVNFEGADLTDTNLMKSSLIGANFTNARLNRTNLCGSNLSQAVGLKTAKEFLSQFKHTRSGIYVFKKFYQTTYSAPSSWVIKPGEYLTETVNPDRATECGCGINFATREWLDKNYLGYPTITQLWLCLIEWPDVADVVVPYSTDGKARCSRLKLVKRLA